MTAHFVIASDNEQSGHYLAPHGERSDCEAIRVSGRRRF